MENEFCIVLITASSMDEGRRIAQKLVEEKHAACVNVIPGAESLYWWEGKIEHAEEVLLIAKTMGKNIQGLEDCVKAHHSYTVPEIVCMPLVKGSSEYLHWLGASVR